MTWPNDVEQWREFALQECKDIPVDLVLSIIRHESRGKAGEISERPSKQATIPTDNGGQKVVNRAMGLMQVIAPNIVAWNEKKKPVITWEDMTGSDERAARLQIRIGCSIFSSYVHKLYQYDPKSFPGQSPGQATPDQLSLAVVAYLVGPGKSGGENGLIPKLEDLKRQGKSLNLKNLGKTFPKWGWNEEEQRWTNRPNQYGQSVWAAYEKNSHTQQNKPSNRWLIPVGIGLITMALFLAKTEGLFKALKPARL